MSASIGAKRAAEAREVLYARSAVVAHAAAISLRAIDMVYQDCDDVEGLLRESLHATKMGLPGKRAVHPNQIDPTQRAFAPDKVEIARARRIAETQAAHWAPCDGACALDGTMPNMCRR